MRRSPSVVDVSGEGIQALIDEGIMPRHTPQQMAAARVEISTVMTPAEPGTASEKVGAGDTAIPDRPAALIDLVTPGAATEYRLGYGNFYVITRYNRSSFYAAAVMDLAAALRASK
jgi:membrane-bound lytic murein transglycosylase B